MGSGTVGRCLVAATLLCVAVARNPDAHAASFGIWSRLEQPIYPPTARLQGIEGQLLVNFDVDDRGRIVHATVERAAPKKVFDEAVLDEMKSWRVNLAEAQRSNRSFPRRMAFVFQLFPCATGGGPFYLDDNNSAKNDLETVIVCASSPTQPHPKESFVDAVIEEQKQLPVYITALHDVATLESTLTGDRTESRPLGVNRGLKTLWLKPVVSPAFRQAGLPAGAVVKFSITGAGRATDIAAVETGSDPMLSAALTRAISLWLFEPVVEGSVGVTRTGYEGALLVGYKNRKTGTCNEPKLSGPVDYEVHLCF
jgi:TonB family protein